METNNTTKTDYDKFSKERNAANDLRVSLSFVQGCLRGSDPEAAELIQEALDKHKQEREQNLWF